MSFSQIGVFLVLTAVIGAAYWFKVRGSVGGDQNAYLAQRLGLQAGEQITSLWFSFHDIDRTIGMKVDHLLMDTQTRGDLDIQTRGTQVMVALTSAGRLAIGDNEKKTPPMGFSRGDVTVGESPKKPEMKKLAGKNGLEDAVVMLVEPKGGQPFRLIIAQSGFEAVRDWCQRN
jgi:hypothetical protein